MPILECYGPAITHNINTWAYASEHSTTAYIAHSQKRSLGPN